MNLFDGLMGADWQDPKTMATLRLAAGLLGGAGPSRTPQSFGGLLGTGLAGYQETMSAAAKQRLLEEELGLRRDELGIRKSEAERKAAEDKRKAEQLLREQEFRMSLVPQPVSPTAALAGGGGPTPVNAAKIGTQGTIDLQRLQAGVAAGLIKPDEAKALVESEHWGKPEVSRVLERMGTNGPEQQQVDKFGNPVGPSIPKPFQMGVNDGVTYNPYSPPGTVLPSDNPNSLMRRDSAGNLTLNQALFDARERLAKSGASKVEVSTGQHGFTNERDLRRDYEGLPETKAFGELTGTISLIRTAAQSPTPANDLALATKFMKLLDPGSVVRESELSMAMGATGLLDKVLNYAAQVTQGVKLTPSQRQDFLTSANRIFAAAEAHQAKVAQRARDNAARWMINPDAVAPVITPTKIDSGGWSIRPK